ncbi:unannotated protein [freshwater metagenome]|uniref:Unannotated protein n=1 Tax=freshwater metagenome TaxID=449393 RepID=A0A6J6EHX5_9ZZZZ
MKKQCVIEQTRRHEGEERETDKSAQCADHEGVSEQGVIIGKLRIQKDQSEQRCGDVNRSVEVVSGHDQGRESERKFLHCLFVPNPEVPLPIDDEERVGIGLCGLSGGKISDCFVDNIDSRNDQNLTPPDDLLAVRECASSKEFASAR